ncbi:MAG: tRNA lysidine(34) synthetase TilS [bacterium]
MQTKILNFLEKYQILNSQKSYVIGFSGGQDSLCMIDILDKISKKNNFKIIAAHLNHNWRGKSSKKEQRSCMEFCKTRGIEFHTKTLDTSIKATEENARIERYKFFEEIILKTSSHGVFTAHTKTDNTETILYRIIKGTGVYGLCAIPEVREEAGYKIFRPMLEITREETEKYCKDNSLTPSTDESNFEDKYARNNLRLNIIPKLKEINPNFDDAIENLSKIAKDYEQIISSNLPSTLEPKTFRVLASATQKTLIHRFLMQNKIDYSHKKIDEITDFINENIHKPCGNTLSLTTAQWLFTSKEKIEIINNIKAKAIDTITEVKINQKNHFATLNKTLTITEFEEKIPTKFPKETDFKAFVNIPESLLPLQLRTRREGDVIQPFGLSGTIKLKKFLINKGVPEHKRDEIMLLTKKNEVLWAIGVGLSEKLRVNEKPTYIIELR